MTEGERFVVRESFEGRRCRRRKLFFRRGSEIAIRGSAFSSPRGTLTPPAASTSRPSPSRSAVAEGAPQGAKAGLEAPLSLAPVGARPSKTPLFPPRCAELAPPPSRRSFFCVRNRPSSLGDYRQPFPAERPPDERWPGGVHRSRGVPPALLQSAPSRPVRPLRLPSEP